MSDIKYGLISETDARCLEKTIDLICNEWHDEQINICEIGLYNCGTAIGLMNYIWAERILDVKHTNYIGIDNCKDKEVENIPEWMTFINGNSNEVYNQIPDESQHLILVDGNHSFPYVVSDYFCYKNKVKIGGYLCFHDTSPQAQGKDWQRMGSEQDPDMSISVLKALKEVGLLNEWKRDPDDWELVLNEFDPNDNAGGIMVFKRIS